MQWDCTMGRRKLDEAGQRELIFSVDDAVSCDGPWIPPRWCKQRRCSTMYKIQRSFGFGSQDGR